MLPYVTLHEAKKHLGLLANDGDDSLIQDWINKSTGLIEWWKDRRYYPNVQTQMLDTPNASSNGFGVFGSHYLDPVSAAFNREEIYLKVEDLLEIVELLNGDGAEIDSEDYLLEPTLEYPKNRIFLRKNSSLIWLPNNLDYRQAISLTGIFGAVQAYLLAFAGSGSKIENTGGIDDEETSIEVLDPLGISNDLITPKFQAGQMLRVQAEYMFVKEVEEGDYDDGTLEVVRAFAGTEAVAHAEDTAIEIYRIPPEISQMCLRLVQWRYRQKDNDNFDRIFNLATQSVSTPSALPADVALILGRRGRFKI